MKDKVSKAPYQDFWTLEEAYEIAEKNDMVWELEEFLNECEGMTEAEIIEDFLYEYGLALYHPDIEEKIALYNKYCAESAAKEANE
jgi:hypothetical protein